MNVIFRTIKIKGFMSLVDETIDFQDLGVVLVKGINNYDPLFKSNGSGKSAIFDSILWCLTGSTSRGSTNVVNRNLSSGTSVELTLSIDSTEYIITRWDGSSGKSLSIIKNGEDISGSTFTKSKDILKSELSFITYDVLTSIIILSQGLPGRLSNLRPSDRKSRLEYLSNTDGILEEIQTKLAETNSRLVSEQSEVNMELTKITTTITSNQSMIESCKRKIEEVTKYNESNSSITPEIIDSYKVKIDELRTNIAKMKSQYQEYVQLESSHKLDLSVVNNNLTMESSQIKDLTNQFKSLSDKVCPFCKSILNSPEELQNHLISQLSEHKARYSQLLLRFDELSAQEVPNSSEYLKTINVLESKLSTYEATVNEYERMKSSVDSYQTTINECESIIKDNESKRLEFNDKLVATNKQVEIYNYYKTAVSRKFRNFLLDGVINYLNKRLEYYSSFLFSNGQIVRLESNGNNINIRLGDSYFEDLSGGEGRRVDIILQLAQRDLSRTESGFSCNLLVLDEILDYLDSDGITNVLSLLERESVTINSLMIVTHMENVSVPSDSELVVVKDENQLSRIRR